MSRKALKNRESRRHKLAEKFSSFRSELRKILKSKSEDVSIEEKIEASAKLSKLPRDSSYQGKVTVVKFVLDLEEFINKRFQLCRLCLRNLIRQGFLPGLKKSSW